ncbi:hypothetical protein L917_21554 [Phytophthora nicotianae]|uniref:Uncharacterized protein n=1 Tax=Phytophthora nicotianae TaxID=4792 RepID=W2JYW8_PHYNI|nr:hypothetical protein L917_21554 [Phytophthora nicotianae]
MAQMKKLFSDIQIMFGVRAVGDEDNSQVCRCLGIEQEHRYVPPGENALDTDDACSETAAASGDIGGHEKLQSLGVAVPTGNGSGANAMEDGNADGAALRAGVDTLHEIDVVVEDDDRNDDATDVFVLAPNRMEPGDDPDAYEVFDACDDPDADAFDKHQEVDDVQLVVVDGRETESDSKDDPIDSNGAMRCGSRRFFSCTWMKRRVGIQRAQQ